MTVVEGNGSGGAIPAELADLLNGAKIYACLKRVSRGIDRFDREMFLSAYHDDAIISAGAMVAGPAEAFDGGVALHEDGQVATLHHLTNHTCEIDSDVAHCETYFFYAARNRDATNWLAGGRYVDRVEQRDGAWRIAFRQTLMEWSGAMAAADVPLFQNALDAEVNGLPSRSRTDPSYHRPLVNRREPVVPHDVNRLGRIGPLSESA